VYRSIGAIVKNTLPMPIIDTQERKREEEKSESKEITFDIGNTVRETRLKHIDKIVPRCHN